MPGIRIRTAMSSSSMLGLKSGPGSQGEGGGRSACDSQPQIFTIRYVSEVSTKHRISYDGDIYRSQASQR